MKTEELELMMAFFNMPQSPVYAERKQELEELKRLATIGEATEKAFEEYYCTMLIVGKNNDEPSCSVQNVSELMDWAKG